jgi:hypothetical protein
MTLRLVVKYKMQKGAALLLFMLLLVLASSYTLVRKLNVAAKPHTREIVTSKVLAEAKQVLLGYAMTYPDKVNPNSGPGYLPCPDLDNDGDAEGGCALAGPVNRTIGRFPNETLDIEELKDASGQRLWYALSDNYRNFAGLEPLNSDTPGQFNIDINVNGIIDVAGEGDIDDIVAVIIAPGEPVIGQNRDPAETDVTVEISNYLEIDNNDLDANFVTRDTTGNSNIFNDTVITITRQELMGMVEKRVLAEVEDRIIEYQNTYAAFPWLSPFADPSSSTYRGTLNTWQGHLPFHWLNDPDSISVGTGSNIAGRNPFQSTVGWIWRTDVGTATGFFSGTVTADCLRNVDCNDGFMPQLVQVTTPAVDCTWTDKDTVDCATAGWVLMSTITTCNQGCGNFTCTREYNVNISEYSGTSSINDPTSTTVRTRDISLNGNLPVQAAAVMIRDIYTGNNPSTSCVGTTTRTIGSGTINFVGSTTGTLSTTGIQYDLDVDDSELPEWFVDNEWQNLIYLSYANGEPLPGDNTDTTPADTIHDNSCTTLGTQCLTVDINGTDITNVRAAALSAGVDLTPLTVRPSATLSEYFDDDNNNLDSVFDKKRITTTYNDQTRIISTAP